MDEAAARSVIMVRAVETTDAGRAVWRDEDRTWASGAAASVVGADAPVDAFVSRRAALALERLNERHPALQRALRATTWRPWVGVAAVVGAFVLGLVADQIGPAKRVNILAFPLLAILAWNVATYAAILVRGAAGLVNARARALGPIARALARLGRGLAPRSTGVAGDPVSGAVGRFMHDWTHASAGLAAARVGCVLHLAAIALALGAIAGLYLRGLVLEYRAGWESTFLGAEAVHRLLAFVLAPASALTGIAVPDAAAIAAIASGPGVNAAPWIHLYAATVAIVVLAPRALLALGTWLASRRLERRFPLALDDAYFQRLARQVSGAAARVQVVPYGHQPAPQAALALQSIVGRVYGPHAQLAIAPGVEWGGEDALPTDLVPGGPLALVVALFALAATPEAENHGAFLAALARRLDAATPLVALVDESGFRKRFAGQPSRLEERRAVWRDALGAARVPPVFLDLDQPDLAAAESDLAAAVELRIAAGGEAVSVDLSLISHTNAGKTTLARTLLGRNVGEVRDAPHVTASTDSHTMIETAQGDALRLWDTPGLGDSARLAKRLEASGNPIGWFLTQVWDRWRDRPFWSSQQALRNVREHADVVLYLVNAAEDPADAGYVAPEMRILAWIGKPAIVLLNQVGEPRPRADESAEEERWRAHVAPYRFVHSVLTLDAFARCWVQEFALLEAIAAALPEDKRAVFARLAESWRARRMAAFDASMEVLATQLARAACDREPLDEEGMRAKLREVGAALGIARDGAASAQERATKRLAARLDEDIRATTDRLIEIHGLEGRAGAEVLSRLAGDFAVKARTSEGKAAVFGGIVSGALSGLAADLAAGGLTFGAGLLAGGVLGALGAAGVARGYNVVRGAKDTSVRWADEFLTGFFSSALLRYLAVAHYGRGRGEWTRSEHPAFWAEAVTAVVAPRRESLAAIWAERSGDCDIAMMKSALHGEITGASLDLFERLYPGALAQKTPDARTAGAG